jgi:protein-disulfide isomerase
MTYHAFKSLTVAALGLAFGLASIARAADAPKVLAVVNGKPLTEAEVRQGRAADFTAMGLSHQRDEQRLLEVGLDDLIKKTLVDAEAAARGITAAEVVAAAKPAPVTDIEVDRFYEENKARITKPKEQVLPQIRQYLEQAAAQKASEDFIAGLKAKYKVEMKLEPLRLAVAPTGPSNGPENAPVTLVEFSDFQCPYCGQFFSTVNQLKAKYGDKVRIVFRQFPLSIHPLAPKAAEAALCANEQGKFWQMHDAMFQNQRALAVEDLKKTAVGLGLDAAKFDSCLDAGRTATTVQRDLQEGGAAGVGSTPSMFINGRFLEGSQTLEQLSEIVDDELRRLAK